MWTYEEDQQLLSVKKEKVDLSVLALALNRSKDECKNRLSFLMAQQAAENIGKEILAAQDSKNVGKIWTTERDSLLWSMNAEKASLDQMSSQLQKSGEECLLRLQILRNRQVSNELEKQIMSSSGTAKNSVSEAGKRDKLSVHVRIICPSDRVCLVLGNSSNIERIRLVATLSIESRTGYAVLTVSALEDLFGERPSGRAALELFGLCSKTLGKECSIGLIVEEQDQLFEIESLSTGARISVTKEASEIVVLIRGEKGPVKSAFILVLDIIRRRLFLQD